MKCSDLSSLKITHGSSNIAFGVRLVHLHFFFFFGAGRRREEKKREEKREGPLPSAALPPIPYIFLSCLIYIYTWEGGWEEEEEETLTLKKTGASSPWRRLLGLESFSYLPSDILDNNGNGSNVVCCVLSSSGLLCEWRKEIHHTLISFFIW